MILSKFVEGIEILRKYYKGGDGYHLGAEHDQIYLYATPEPVSPEDVVRLRRLDWFQPDVDTDSDDADDATLASEYDPEEGWSVFT